MNTDYFTRLETIFSDVSFSFFRNQSVAGTWALSGDSEWQHCGSSGQHNSFYFKKMWQGDGVEVILDFPLTTGHKIFSILFC